MTEAEALQDFSRAGVAYKEIDTNQGSDSAIHSVSVGCLGKTDKDLLVFIHGSPGNWIHFWRYMKDPDLLSAFCMIGLDRPGFGSSPGPLPDVDKQAKRILNSLYSISPKSPKRKFVLVGHSYGGPVAARIAALEGNSVTHLVLLAAALDPEKEELKWYNRAANTGLARSVLPADLLTSNLEMLPMKEQLLAIEPDWKKLKAEVYIMQGGKDSLVSPENLNFARRTFPLRSIVKEIYLPEEGHFLPWKNFSTVKGLLSEISGKRD
ncbi:alpha/beta fold hydrolase [Leptospira fletcheri]|uniref:Alpha/beta fold hydrolase n=1 Tax=Leptospira fletcheri TaxID=2484981 RepID=A0A4R9GLZ6_9LEPT|nr:alpha/beta fold hydrolase [Leptospira fletcheri]TGK14123.1 alpha/beta fold hydrolase [Leptospira fletcheri]